jgi:hypothetical protein
MSQVTFARAVLRHDPSSQWVSVNANQLPPSGSSIFQPHLQGSANPVPTTVQRLLADLGPARVREYVELERHDGERLIASTERVEWMTAFAPVGPAEIRGFVADAASPEELDEAAVAELADGLSRMLRLYASLARLSELQLRAQRRSCDGTPPAARVATGRARVLRTASALRRHVERAAALGGGDRSRARAGRRVRTRALRSRLERSLIAGTREVRPRSEKVIG